MSDEPVLFKRPDDWLAWLAKNHPASQGIWLRLAKKGSNIQAVTYVEALDGALCYGWIDAQKKGESETAWLQRFTPRKTKSIWSKINREKALALIASNRMQPAGLEQVERAKKDGRWDAAYDGQRTSAVPEDLQSAFDKNPKAEAFFATLDSANRYAVLWRIQTAKKAETRARKIDQLVAMLARHEKIHQSINSKPTKRQAK